MWEDIEAGLQNLSCRGVDDCISLLTRFCTLFNNNVPKDEHKGLASRKNILERLRMTADACAREENRSLWAWTSIVFVPKQQGFYRVVTLYNKQAGRWTLVDQDIPEVDRLRKMKQYTAASYKATLEAVDIQHEASLEHKDAVVWRIQASSY